MPIIEIDYVEHRSAPLKAGTAQKVVDAIAAVLSSPVGHTWARMHAVPRESYAENGVQLPSDLAPVFVRVLLAQLPEAPELESCARDLTRAVAESMGRPLANVHIVFEPPALGRIAFGGELRKE